MVIKIKDKILNPEVFTEEEKEYWCKLEKIYKSLLFELKSKNLIKSVFQQEEGAFIKVVQDSNRFFDVYNSLNNVFEKGKSREFVKATKSFGINENNLPYLYVSQAISTFLINTEQFKNALLLILVKQGRIRETMTLGQLLNALLKISPIHGKAIKDDIDVDLRNALSHGLYWFEPGGMIHYSKDISFSKIKQISLGDLLIKAKSHNILFQCFLSTIAQKISEGFFS